MQIDMVRYVIWKWSIPMTKDTCIYLFHMTSQCKFTILKRNVLQGRIQDHFCGGQFYQIPLRTLHIRTDRLSKQCIPRSDQGLHCLPLT